MNYTPDLFGDPSVAPGKTDTSREAAQAVQPKAATLRAEVLAEIRRLGEVGGTPSEIAARTRIHLLNVRPRTTELKAMGEIADSGKRRKNSRGKNEIVWVVRQ